MLAVKASIYLFDKYRPLKQAIAEPPLRILDRKEQYDTFHFRHIRMVPAGLEPTVVFTSE